MSWFAVSVFLRSVHTPPIASELEIWEEQILLIEAESPAAALSKTVQKARYLESEYQTLSGDHTRWCFERVDKLCEVSTLVDGAELFSRFLRRSEVESLIRPID